MLPGPTARVWWILFMQKWSDFGQIPLLMTQTSQIFQQECRVSTLYEELNSLTFPDHVYNFSLTKLTCNSYFSLHFSRLLLPYTDSLCYHYRYHILNH